MKRIRLGLRVGLGAASVLIALSQTGEDTGKDFTAALSERAMDLRIEKGRLVGAGAEWLRERARESQFFFIGEEHGVAEVLHLAESLWKDLVPLGYRHIALEISPRQAEKLERYARLGDTAALEDYKASALPQLPDTARELFEFVRSAARAAPPRTTLLWGLEQEQRALPLFERLEELAPNDAAREAAEAAHRSARAEEAAGNRIIRGYAREIEAVKAAFRPRERTEAASIIAALELSNRLYEGQESAATGFASNLEREEMLQQNFLEHYRRAERRGEARPRVLLDLGAWHGMRGFSPTNISSLGNFVDEFGRSNKSRMFNVIVTCGRNGKRAGVGQDAGKELPCGADEAEFFRPILAAARHRWTLFDLRPLRGLIHAGRIDPGPEAKPYIFAYDALLVIAETTPTHSEAPAEP